MPGHLWKSTGISGDGWIPPRKDQPWCFYLGRSVMALCSFGLCFRWASGYGLLP